MLRRSHSCDDNLMTFFCPSTIWNREAKGHLSCQGWRNIHDQGEFPLILPKYRWKAEAVTPAAFPDDESPKIPSSRFNSTPLSIIPVAHFNIHNCSDHGWRTKLPHPPRRTSISTRGTPRWKPRIPRLVRRSRCAHLRRPILDLSERISRIRRSDVL